MAVIPVLYWAVKYRLLDGGERGKAKRFLEQLLLKNGVLQMGHAVGSWSFLDL